jgi:hypothetical protein
MLGMRLRPSIGPVLKVRGNANVVIMSYWTAVFIACYMEVQSEPWTASIGNTISWTFIIGAIGSTLLGIYFRRRKAMVLNA